MAWMLDTDDLVWALFEPGKLGKSCCEILSDPVNEVLVSPVSYWKISLKFGLGELVLPGTDPSEIPAAALQLGVADDHLSPGILSTLHRLPYAPDHRYPFDRLLVWHAIHNRRTLLSRDRALPSFKAHGLKSVW